MLNFIIFWIYEIWKESILNLNQCNILFILLIKYYLRAFFTTHLKLLFISFFLVKESCNLQHFCFQITIRMMIQRSMQLYRVSTIGLYYERNIKKKQLKTVHCVWYQITINQMYIKFLKNRISMANSFFEHKMYNYQSL